MPVRAHNGDSLRDPIGLVPMVKKAVQAAFASNVFFHRHKADGRQDNESQVRLSPVPGEHFLLSRERLLFMLLRFLNTGAGG